MYKRQSKWRLYEVTATGLRVAAWFVDGRATKVEYRGSETLLSADQNKSILSLNWKDRLRSRPIIVADSPNEEYGYYTEGFSFDGGHARIRRLRDKSTGGIEIQVFVTNPENFTPNQIAENKAQYEKNSPDTRTVGQGKVANPTMNGRPAVIGGQPAP